MARFYGTVERRKSDGSTSTTASRQGVVGVDAHIRGWDAGIQVWGYINPTTGEDEFEVWTTGGSHNANNRRMIGTLTSRGFLHANPS